MSQFIHWKNAHTFAIVSAMTEAQPRRIPLKDRLKQKREQEGVNNTHSTPPPEATVYLDQRTYVSRMHSNKTREHLTLDEELVERMSPIASQLDDSIPISSLLLKSKDQPNHEVLKEWRSQKPYITSKQLNILTRTFGDLKRMQLAKTVGDIRKKNVEKLKIEGRIGQSTAEFLKLLFPTPEESIKDE